MVYHSFNNGTLKFTTKKSTCKVDTLSRQENLYTFSRSEDRRLTPGAQASG